jgi:CRISPR-associated protein Cmr6
MAESILACRDQLRGLPLKEASNAGLALARYIEALGDHKSITELHSAVANLDAGAAYRAAFKRWMAAHKERQSQLIPLKLASPLAIGLGNESPTEIGITLQHTYGTPVIPGSAVKGLVRSAAQLLQKAGDVSCEQFDALFGTTESASHFVFWDAWYDPATVDGKPLHRDIITVHHPKYYNNGGKDAWPTDFDDPTPVPFVVVRPKAGFLFVIDAPSTEWAEFATHLLKWSLAKLGAGAKTSSGYGRFEDSAATSRVPQETEEWRDVQVKRNRGSGELRSIYKDVTALASGQAAKDLLASLPEWARNELQDKKKKNIIQADVKVRVLGNSREIVAITPKSGSK